ncbi:MAG: TIGR03032 family protein [Alphaproteobacteria bacterium]
MNETTPQPRIELSHSRHFTAWLAEARASLAFTTYQTGKLFLIGLRPDGRLSVFERTFSRCMGLATDGPTLWMSSLYQLWRFQNALDAGASHNGYDHLYVPQVGYTTGDLDVHDIALGADGRPIFVNTLFSCLATISETASFVPLWRPSFITRLAAEDRCHLNGLALRHGVPATVTLVGRSDVADGWREKRRDGGLALDVASGETACAGLSMPHSPRWRDGRLWLLDSGNGYFGHVDPSARFERVAFCPGYARGLAFAGNHAVIGLSKPRENRTFSGLALDDELARHGAEARCGLLVVDLASGDAVHWLRIEGIVSELYDVVVLPGTQRPMALGFRSDEIKRTVTIGTH